jgi:hypothetical protein
MNTTCSFCEKWVSTTWEQHLNRIENRRLVPHATVNPCPHCGSTWWAGKPPPGPAPAPLEPARVNWTFTMRVIAALAAAVLIAALFALLMPHLAHAQTTFFDASGRRAGTATRDANGTTTFRDGAGRMTGTANTNSNGTTTFRDGTGRMTGTAERRR